jgi:hypothetical protein
MTIQEAQELFTGKRVEVFIEKYKSVAGECSFIGVNEFLNWPLQITIDRMPIVLNNLNQVKLQKL